MTEIDGYITINYTAYENFMILHVSTPAHNISCVWHSHLHDNHENRLVPKSMPPHHAKDHPMLKVLI